MPDTPPAGQAPAGAASVPAGQAPADGSPHAAGQAPAPIIPPVAAGQVPAPEEGADSDASEPFDVERARRKIDGLTEDKRKLRDELKKRDADLKELAQLRAERQKAEDARLSEIERATKRAQHLEAELQSEKQDKRERAIDYEIERHASRLGIVDPEAARLLLDKASLEYAPDGQPTDVDRALKLLLKDRPYLAGQAPATGGPTSAGNPATRTQAPGQRLYSRADLADYAFYRKNQADIQAAYREGRIVE